MLSILALVVALLAIACVGQAEDSKKLAEGELFDGSISQSTWFEIGLRDRNAPVSVYILSDKTPVIIASKDNEDTYDFETSIIQTLEVNSKNVIDLETLQVPSSAKSVYFRVAPRGATKLKVVAFNSFATVEGIEHTFKTTDGYDYKDNNYYRYFHTFICPGNSQYVRMTGKNGAVYGVASGLAQKDSQDLICKERESNSVCESDNLGTEKFIDFSILLNQFASGEEVVYSVMSQTMEEGEAIQLDKVQDLNVSVYETCAMVRKLNMGTENKREDSLVVAAWSKNVDTSARMYIYVNKERARSGGDNSPEPEYNFVEYAYDDIKDSDQLYVEVSPVHTEFALSEVTPNTVSVGLIASQSLVQLHTTNPLKVVDSSSINDNMKNVFFMYPQLTPMPLNSLEDAVVYDMVFSFEIVREANEPYEAAGTYNVTLIFDEMEVADGVEVTSATVNNSALEKGQFIMQGIKEASDEGFEGRMPFMRIEHTNKEVIEGTFYATLAPIVRFSNNTPYTITLRKGVATHFSLDVSGIEHHVQVDVSTRTINLSDESVSINLRCSQDYYTHNNEKLVTSNKITKNRNDFKIDLVEGKNKLYCSVLYDSTNEDDSVLVLAQIMTYSSEKYISIYEGTPLPRTIDAKLSGDDEVVIDVYKLLGESVLQSEGKLDEDALNYNYVFAKVELVGAGRRNADGSFPEILDQNDSLTFCITNSLGGSCYDENNKTIEDSASVNAEKTIDMIEAEIDYEKTMGRPDAHKYHPSNTYITIDTRNLAAAHSASYILTVGYGIQRDYTHDEISHSNMSGEFAIYYNNNNKSETEGNHVQFLKLGVPAKFLYQMNINLSSASDVELNDIPRVVAVACRDYPELDAFIQNGEYQGDHVCISYVLNNVNKDAGITFGLSSATAQTYWYLSIMPFKLPKGYMGKSRISMQFEEVLVVPNSTTIPFKKDSQLKYPMAFTFDTGARVSNSLLSFDIKLNVDVKLTICLTGAQASISATCVAKKEVEGIGNHKAEFPVSADLIALEYEGESYRPVGYFNLIGPEDTNAIDVAKESTISLSFRKNGGINSFSLVEVAMTASEKGATPTSNPNDIYFLPLETDINKYMDDLIFVIKPPTAIKGQIPNFYSESKFKIEFFPNRDYIEQNDVGVWSVTEKGYIVYPLGKELSSRKIESIANGISVRISYIYDSFKLDLDHDNYTYSAGLFYKNTSEFKALDITQITSSFFKLYKTEDTEIPENTSVLPNYFRIAPKSENDGSILNLQGLYIMACKGLPTLYYTYSSETKTPFPSADKNDKIVNFTGGTSEDGSPIYKTNAYESLAEDELTQYMYSVIEPAQISTASNDYSYVVMADNVSQCVYKSKKNEIILNGAYVINEKYYASVGFAPATIPEACKDAYDGKVEYKYALYAYRLESEKEINSISDIPDYEVQPTSCGMLTYGQPADLDSIGGIMWYNGYLDDYTKIVTNINFDFKSSDPNKKVVYVLNVIGKFNNSVLLDNVAFSYGGLILKESYFDVMDDGTEKRTFEDLKEPTTVTLSPIIKARDNETGYEYVADKYYFQVNVLKTTEDKNVTMVLCINTGYNNCLLSKETEVPKKVFDTETTKKSGVIFSLGAVASSQEAADPIPQYSAVFGPSEEHNTIGVTLEGFGTSIHQLLKNTTYTDPTTTTYIQMIENVQDSNNLLYYGYIDITWQKEARNYIDNPLVKITATLDLKNGKNSELVQSGETVSANMFMCVDFPLTDPALVSGNDMSATSVIGDNCIYLGSLSIKEGTTPKSTLIIEIPFKTNRKNKEEIITINGEKYSLKDVSDKFSTKSSNTFFFGFSTHNAPYKFRWTTETFVSKIGGDGLPGWGIALIVVGSIIVAGGIGFCLYFFVFRKKVCNKSDEPISDGYLA